MLLTVFLVSLLCAIVCAVLTKVLPSTSTMEPKKDRYGDAIPGTGGVVDVTRNKNYATMGVVVFLAIVVITIIMSSVHFVPAGRAGLVTRFGAVTGRTVEPGPNLTFPFFESLVLYDTRVRKVPFTDLDSASSEYQDVKVTGILNYRVNPAAVAWLFENVGTRGELEEKVLVPALSQNLKSILPSYPILEILTNRDTIAQQLTEAMVTTFAGYRTDEGDPVVFFAPRDLVDEDAITACEEQTAEAEAEANTGAVDLCLPQASVFLSNVAFTDVFNDAIETKQVEEQKIETEANKLLQAEIVADQVIAEANGRAEANILLAASLRDQGEQILSFLAIQALVPNIRVLLLDSDSGIIPVLSEGLLSGVDDVQPPGSDGILGPVQAEDETEE